MPRKAKTLVLTDEERSQLTEIDHRGSDWRERQRARTVLLLDKGESLGKVATKQAIHRETVASRVRQLRTQVTDSIRS